MANTFSKIHGTTVDKFSVGTKNDRVTLTGSTVDAAAADLKDRDGNNHTAGSTVFFTAHIIGRSSSGTAAFELKGCYVAGTTSVTGSVLNTYVNTSAFPSPTISFTSGGLMTLTCTGVAGQTTAWSATVDFTKI